VADFFDDSIYVRFVSKADIGGSPANGFRTIRGKPVNAGDLKKGYEAASPSANARPLSAGRRPFNARKDSNCRKLRRETGAALARLRAGPRRGEAADAHNERQAPENSR
jgi:hypothetical protein